mgnify:CR=1 FL=1
MEKNILNYVLDNGKNIALTEAERKMLVQMFQMLIGCLEQMKQQPNTINIYEQALYQAIEKVQNDGKVITEKESAEAEGKEA